MSGTYEVFCDGRAVGKVQVLQQGLYYRFTCSCQIEDGGMYELLVKWNDELVNLGLLLPKDGCFWLDRRIATKKIGQGRLSFSVRAKNAEIEGHFVPVSEQAPFAYISRLKDGHLCIKDGCFGIILPN